MIGRKRNNKKKLLKNDLERIDLIFILTIFEN
jgi:hypothetical protein